MSNANFGLRSRGGRGNNRPAAASNPWTQVHNRNQQGIASAAHSPEQQVEISTKNLAYCVFALGYDKKKPPPAQAQLIRHILSILRHGDPKLAFLPYDKTSKANALSFPTAVPTTPGELAVYFPEFKHYLRRFRTKCRITSELPLWQIKTKVFQQLKANDFWMNPTSMVCQTSEKCGFFLYAHHFITQQSDFRRILDPILKEDWGEQEDYEYDFQAESIAVTVDGDRVTAKVFLLRSNPKFTSKLQQTLSRIYATTSSVNLGIMGRYKYIPLTTNAVVSDITMQGLLRAQNAYAHNVFVYVCQNISNIDYEFDLPEPTSTASVTETPPSTYKYSLRSWFYDLEASDQTNLIHAVYSMPETTTIKVLCERSKKDQVLSILHDLPTYVVQYFHQEAATKYFPTMQSHPFVVDKFPHVSQACGTYVQELNDYAMANPQSDGTDTPLPSQAPSNTNSANNKRNRQGEPITTHTNTSESVLSPQVLQQIQNNAARLQEISTANISRDNTLTNIGNSLEQLGRRLGATETAITHLTTTQTTQGELIQMINNKQGILENHLTRLCTHFGLSTSSPELSSESPSDVNMQDVDEAQDEAPVTQTQQQHDASNTPNGADGGAQP